MTKLCLTYCYDHKKHVMIQRQLRTFLEAGLTVSVIDQAGNKESDTELPYRHRRVKSATWDRGTNLLWRVIRRIPNASLHRHFWRGALCLQMVSNILQLAFAILGEDADCVVAEDLQAAVAACLASKLRRCTVYYCAFEIESEQGGRDELRQGFLRSLEQMVVPRVDRLIAPNHSRAMLYTERYGVRRQPLVVLNCPPTHLVQKSKRLHQILGLDESTRIVLYHGALIPFRALDNLVHSVSFFNPNIVLVLMGDQSVYYHEVLAPLLNDDQIRHRTFVIPPVPQEDVALYVVSADLGVVIYENVNLNNYMCAPMKLYEYIMAQVPIAGCNFPEITDLFQQYPVGVTFAPEDPVSIARAVNSFFAKSAVQKQQVQQALAGARDVFRWELEGQKWLDLLRTKGIPSITYTWRLRRHKPSAEAYPDSPDPILDIRAVESRRH